MRFALDNTRYRIALGAVAAMALGLRLMWLLRGGDSWAVATDSHGYLVLAEGLRHGCGFARWVNGACGSAEALRTPGYPVLVALLGAGPRTVVAVQALMGVAVCLGAAWFVQRRWGRSAALLAAALVAFDVPSILSSKVVMTETFFQLLVLAAVLTLLYPRTSDWARGNEIAIAAVSGSLFALAILVRPIAEPLFVLAPLYLLAVTRVRWPRRLVLLGVVCAAPVLTIAGWSLRNARTAGIGSLSTVGALNLYSYKVPLLIWHRNAGDLRTIEDGAARRFDSRFYRSFYTNLPAGTHPSAHDELWDLVTRRPSSAKQMFELGVQAVISHPLGMVKMTLRGLLMVSFQPHIPDFGLRGLLGLSESRTARSGYSGASWRGLLFRLAVALTVVFQVALLAVIWLGVVRALWRYLTRLAPDRAELLLLSAVAFGLFVLAAGGGGGVEAFARYRMPAVPLLAIVAAAGWFSASAPIIAQDGDDLAA